MRVTLVSHTYAAEVNHQKIRALAALQDLEIQLIVPSRWPDGEMGRVLTLGELPDALYEIERIEPLLTNVHSSVYFLRPRALWRAIKRFDPHLVHIEEEPWTCSAFEVAVISRLLHKPLIFFTWENLDRKYPGPLSMLNNFVLKSCAMAIAGNHEGREILRARGLEKPVAVLHQLGVDRQQCSPGDGTQIRNSLGLTDEFVIGFVGRLVEGKGLRFLIEAIARQSTSPKLLVLGAGPLRESLEAQARSVKVAEQISWVGAVPHDEVVRYLRAMDVLVLPSIETESWKEQFGHVLIEAMGCGIPVIGSGSGEIPRVIGDAGIVFPEGDVGALAAGLKLLEGDDALRRSLAVKGRERVLQSYTHEALAGQMASIYRELVSSMPTEPK